MTSEDFETESKLRDACISQPVAPAHCHPSPTNPRKTFDPDKHADLTASVGKHGVIQPIVVRPWPAAYAYATQDAPRWEIVAGERRWRAASAAGVRYIPAIIRHLSDAEVLEIQVIENLQRDDLHPLEEAEGFHTLMTQTGTTADQLADKIGKSRGYVYAALKLLSLTDTARDAFRAGQIEKSVAIPLARLPADRQTDALAEILPDPEDGDEPETLSTREALEVIRDFGTHPLRDAPWPLDGLVLYPSGTPCSACNKTTEARFGGRACTDLSCWGNKRQVWISELRTDAQERGITLSEARMDWDTHATLKANLYFMTRHDIQITDVYAANPFPLFRFIDKDGKHTDFALKTDIESAANAIGITRKDAPQTDWELKQASATAEGQRRRTLRDAILDAWDTPHSLPSCVGQPELADIVRLAFVRASETDKTAIARRWAERQGKTSAPATFLAQSLPDLDVAELYRIGMELVLLPMTDAPYPYGDHTTPAPLLALARRYGIDPDALLADPQPTGGEPAETPSTPVSAAQAPEESLAAQAKATPTPPAAQAETESSSAPAAKPKGKKKSGRSTRCPATGDLLSAAGA